LQKQWKKIGSTTRKIEQELWSRFQEANDYFFSNQVKHFESRTLHTSVDVGLKS
jgi:hypothetical protein